jgi:cell division protease FtsH
MPDGNGGFGPKAASAETEKVIDEEVTKIVEGAYDHCMKTLSDARSLVDEMCEALLDKETLDYNELQEMLDNYQKKKEAIAA